MSFLVKMTKTGKVNEVKIIENLFSTCSLKPLHWTKQNINQTTIDAGLWRTRLKETLKWLAIFPDSIKLPKVTNVRSNKTGIGNGQVVYGNQLWIKRNRRYVLYYFGYFKNCNCRQKMLTYNPTECLWNMTWQAQWLPK